MSRNNNLGRHVRSDKCKWIITFILLAVLILGFVGMALVLNKSITTKEIRTSAYEIGALDSSGEHQKSSKSIYTKDYFTVDGLKCTLSKDAEITYQLFFYDEDEEFVSSSASLSVDWSGIVPATAEYFRVVITPTEGDKVTSSEVSKYAKQLTVTINR